MAAGLGFKEFTTGDVLTAADANGYLASQVVMVFASAAARTSAIASPQEGMISYLKDTNSTEYYSGSAWVAIGGSAATFVGCSLKKSTTQSISNATWTAITWNQEDYDTNTFHDNSTNNSRITIPAGKGGKYLFVYGLAVQANATTTRNMQLYKNGTLLGNYHEFESINSDFARSNYSITLDLVATDYIEVYLYQASGGALTVDESNGASRTWTYFQANYLGA